MHNVSFFIYSIKYILIGHLSNKSNIIDSFITFYGILISFNAVWVAHKFLINSVFFYNDNGRFFSNNLIIQNTFNEKKVYFYITKNTRFGFQRKLAIFFQNNVNKNAIVYFFNKVFNQNNLLVKKQNYQYNRYQKKLSKKLRSVKFMRNFFNIEDEDESIADNLLDVEITLIENQISKFFFKSIIQKIIHNLNTSKKSYNNIGQSYFFKKSPLKHQKKNTYTKFQVSKQVQRILIKKIRRKLVYNLQLVDSSIKPIKPQALYFKLYPSTFNESTLNSNLFNQLKAVFSFILCSRFSIYKLNAISLTRFVFDCRVKEQLKKNKLNSRIKPSQHYLKRLDRIITSRFRYVGVFIKDLIRVCFFSMYLKKANFIANFYAFTISKLPRTRKELKFVHFLIKLLKLFATQYKEITGVRIRFQGRLNR